MSNGIGYTNQRMADIQSAMGVFGEFISNPRTQKWQSDPLGCDFLVGNPHEMPLPGFVEAMQRWIVPQNKDWFAYKMSEPPAQAAVAESLRRQRGINFDPQDIHLTTGAFGALVVALNTLVQKDDEVIFISPPWFFFVAMIVAAGGKPVRARVNPLNFDLDLDVISAAINPRTRAIIINSPNNPTGKIYPPETLKDLANLLTRASDWIGRPIFLISDESYYRIVYDNRQFPSPTSYYPYSLMVYTYGKTLLTPGQRLGYIALPPSMPDRETMRQLLFISQLIQGHIFPNAVLQYALPELEKLSVDIPHLQVKRDRLVGELSRIGYELQSPEGTFYLLPRSPLADDRLFIELLAENHIYCLPGSVMEMPGYFRVSATASDDMIERSLPGFALAYEKARQMAAETANP
jgi:aspartate aminotransferase